MKKSSLVSILLLFSLLLSLFLSSCSVVIRPKGDGDEQTPGTDKPSFGAFDGGDLCRKTIFLTNDSLLRYFSVDCESVTVGDTDLLSYRIAGLADSEAIPCDVQGVRYTITIGLTVRYLKEITDGVRVYDTCNTSLTVNELKPEGQTALTDVPCYRQDGQETGKCRFTVLEVQPIVEIGAGKLTYSSLLHTYKEPVDFESAPKISVISSEDKITLKAAPAEPGKYLYDGVKLKVELNYTFDNASAPDFAVRWESQVVELELNMGGYGHYDIILDPTQGKGAPRAAASTVGVCGYIYLPHDFCVSDNFGE